MINAIYSNLISLLWAQAESRVPTLWLCTWLCWFFFILPLFICLYHGLQDIQCGWHGVGLQTRLAEKRCNAASSEMNSGRVWSHPKSCLSPRPPTFLHKRYEMRRSLNIFSIFCFLKNVLIEKPLRPIFLIPVTSFRCYILKMDQGTGQERARSASLRRDRVFTDFLLELVTARGL